MKLRLHRNSIRLRLTQTEVTQFAKTGRVESVIEFGTAPADQFIYSLSAEDGLAAPTVNFEDRRIGVRIPRDQADEWTGSENTGISAEHAIDGGRHLHILIEKDFTCIKKRDGEDDVDTFPNPMANRMF